MSKYGFPESNYPDSDDEGFGKAAFGENVNHVDDKNASVRSRQTRTGILTKFAKPLFF